MIRSLAFRRNQIELCSSQVIPEGVYVDSQLFAVQNAKHVCNQKQQKVFHFFEIYRRFSIFFGDQLSMIFGSCGNVLTFFYKTTLKDCSKCHLKYSSEFPNGFFVQCSILVDSNWPVGRHWKISEKSHNLKWLRWESNWSSKTHVCLNDFK